MLRILLIAMIVFQGVGYSWSFASGTKSKDALPGEVRRFEFPDDQDIYCVAFSPDGSKVIAATGGGQIWVWDKKKAKGFRKFKVASGKLLTGGILSLAFSADGKRVLLGCADGTVRLWDLETEKQIKKLKGHRGPVWSVTFFKSGKCALSGSTSDYTILEWDLENGKEVRRFQGDERASCLSLSPDEGSFVTTESTEIKLWNLKSGKAARSFKGHEYRVQRSFFLPGGEHIISVSAEALIKVWEVKTGKCLRTFGDGEILVEDMAISMDGSRLLLGKVGGMQLWDIETGKKVKQFDKILGRVMVALSPDGRYALTGEWGRVRLWELPKHTAKSKK